MIKTILHRLFQVIYFMVFLWIVILMIEKTHFYFLLGIAFLGILCIVYYYLDDYPIGIPLLIMTILLVYCGYILQFKPVADLGNIYKMAQNYAITGSMTHIYDHMKFKYYLSVYPNNDFLFLIIASYFRLIYLIIGVVPSTFAGILLNVGVIDISFILTYKLAQSILDTHKAQFVCLLFVLFSPFYLYSTFYYTDTLVMPFMLLSLYLYCKGGKMNLFVSMLCAFLAYKMKGNMLLLIIVMIIYTLIAKPIKKSILYILSSILIVALLSNGFTEFIYRSQISSPQLEEKYKMPIAHWIGMSLIGDGGFRRDDFEEIKNAGSYQQKNKKCIKRIKNRLKCYKPSSFYEHCKDKVTYTWCDGTYFSLHQTYFYPLAHHAVAFPNHPLHYFFNSSIYTIYADMYQCMILITLLLSVSYNRKSITPLLLIQGMVLGSVLFFLFWETRSRYILSLTPLFFLLSACSIDKISSCLFPNN